MSVNLHCEECDLWQTPSYITDMCLSLNSKGKPDGGMKGIKRRYLIWVHSHLYGIWDSEAEYKTMTTAVKAHYNKVKAIKKPTFYAY